MAKVTVEEEYLNDIGLALQEKTGTTDKFYPQDMGNSIRAIPSGGSPFAPELDITILCFTVKEVS